MAVSVMIVGAGFRIERCDDVAQRRAKPAQHLFKDMIAADAQTMVHHLHLGVPIAEMPGDPPNIVPARSNLDEILGFAGHAHE